MRIGGGHSGRGSAPEAPGWGQRVVGGRAHGGNGGCGLRWHHTGSQTASKQTQRSPAEVVKDNTKQQTQQQVPHSRSSRASWPSPQCCPAGARRWQLVTLCAVQPPRPVVSVLAPRSEQGGCKGGLLSMAAGASQCCRRGLRIHCNWDACSRLPRHSRPAVRIAWTRRHPQPAPGRCLLPPAPCGRAGCFQST